MGKWISFIAGLLFSILGVIGIIAWRVEVWNLIKAVLALALFFIGLGAIIFGIGELRTSATPPPALPPQQSDQPQVKS
jgi:hypothetical protein